MLEFLTSLLVTNIIISFLDYHYIIKRSKKISELEYLKKKHKKKLTNKYRKRNSIIVAIANGLIISFVSNFVFYSKLNYFIAFSLSFLILLLLINIIYNYILIKFIK